MKHFFKKLAVFLFPIAILLALVIASAFYFGEAIPITTMINWQAQSETTIVYQPWHARAIYDYKFAAIQYHQPSVMILGSSRMTHFRAALANQDPTQFYNASVDGTDISFRRLLLEELIAEDTIPDVIIIGLDIKNFGGEAVGVSINYNFSPLTGIYNIRYTYSGIRRVSRMWIENPTNIISYGQNLWQNDAVLIGLASLSNEHGYIWDGSRFILEFEEHDAEFTAFELDMFEQRRGQFATYSVVNEYNLNIVEQILIMAQENEITVIGVLPPYKPSFIERMVASEDFDYQVLATLALQDLFAEYEFPFYDITDPRTIGGGEDEMIDPWHFSDLLSLRIYHYLLERHPDVFSQYSDLDTLSTWLDEYQDSGIETFMMDLP